VTALVSGRSLPTRVLILSVHANAEYVIQSLQAGALGYLLKGSDVAELEAAIRAVAAGERYLGRGISPGLEAPASVSPAGASTGPAVADPLSALTPRQREILRLVALGHTSRQIAELFDLSTRTVEAHRRQIMDRLDVHDLAGLVRLSIRAGLIPG
jgi:DNA-binding NarL/FixJ family response regulator